MQLEGPKSKHYPSPHFYFTARSLSRGDMHLCATRVGHSSSRISTAVPQMMFLSASDGYAQFQLPSLRIESPVASPVRMSLRRLSWRRRGESSQSPTQGQYQSDPGLAPLHRSVSDVSPVSPLSDRNSIIENDNRRLSRMGFVRRPPSQETAFMSPTQEWISYTGPFPSIAPTTSRSTSHGLMAFPERTSSRSNIPMIQTSTTRRIDPSYSQAYHDHSPLAQRDSYYDRTYQDWSGSQSFTDSPTNYTGPPQVGHTVNRQMVAPRMSRPPGSIYATYPPAGTPVSALPAEPEETFDDEFTSPTDFALFAEATSSLDITPLPSPNPTGASGSGWPRHNEIPFPASVPRPSRPNYPYASHQHSLSQARLAAPLPPLPHQRARSSPAAGNVARRIPIRQQMLAEAITGLSLDDSRTRNSDEDDELPNYEQSQAEFAAHRRREAAARARELEENWSRARRRGL